MANLSVQTVPLIASLEETCISIYAARTVWLIDAQPRQNLGLKGEVLCVAKV